MSNNIDFIAEKYKTKEDLKAYADAQYKTIIKLTKRIAKLEDEKKELLKKVEDASIKMAIDNPTGVSDEEAICVMELNKLRNKSLVEDLTMEECRKVETYVKTLATIRNQPKKIDINTKGMSTEDLLKHFDLAMNEEIEING